MKPHPDDEQTTRKLFSRLLRAEPSAERVRTLLQSGPDWSELQRLLLHHQVLPQVYQGLKPHQASIPTEEYERLQRMHAGNTLRNLAMRRELNRIMALLKQAGIAQTPLRGPALAEQAYGDIALRVFSDLDLWLPQAEVLQAVETLAAIGYRFDGGFPVRRWPSLARVHNQLALVHSEQGHLVELHWRLFNPLYNLDLDTRLTTAPGEDLSDEELLVVLSAHGAKHLWERLKWVVDLDRLARSADDLDWERVVALAEEAGCLRMVLLGLTLAGHFCDLEMAGPIRERIKADSAVAGLATFVTARMFAHPFGKRRFLAEYRYHLAVRERAADRLTLSWRWPLWPRIDDWLNLPAGDRCFLLFLLARPVRMIGKWIFKPVLSRLVGSNV